MEACSFFLPIVLSLIAAFFLTVETWPIFGKKATNEDIMGDFEKQLSQIILELNDTEKNLKTEDVMKLANLILQKIQDDKDSTKNDVIRAKIGIYLLIAATIIQSLSILQKIPINN